MQRRWVMLGSFMMLLSVAIGAFGAHALGPRIGEDHLAVYETGVRYHMIHAAGLLIIGMAAGQWGASSWLKWAARLLFAGIILFSGSLYLLSITNIRILGAITPLGGICFMGGWLMFMLAAAGLKKDS